jgi:hypothetical protein
MRVASLLVHEHWARRTTVGVALDNFTVTEVHTRTTRFGASTPLTKLGKLAVHWARNIHVAMAYFVKMVARHTTCIRLGYNLPQTLVGAATAGLGTCTPGQPATE